MRFARIFLLCCLVPAAVAAQQPADGRFGCFGSGQEYRSPRLYKRPNLKFVPITESAVIQRWKTRPIRSFHVSSDSQPGWKQIDFYLWHEKLPPEPPPYDRQTYESLSIALYLTGPAGEQWFELMQPDPAKHRDQEGILFVSRKSDDPEETPADENTPEQGSAKPQEDPDLGIARWVSVQFAAPKGDLPLFVVRYFEYSEANTANYRSDKELLIDLRGLNPEVVAAGECTDTETTRGNCAAIASAYADREAFTCSWDSPAADFHCNSRCGYGAPDSYRTVQQDFYLIADKPVSPAWAANSPPDLVTWAQSLHKSGSMPIKSAMIPRLGPTTFLARYAELLPQADVLVFASPEEGWHLNARFSLVIIPEHGEPSVQTVEKWDIGGEKPEQHIMPWPSPGPREFSAPVDDGDKYKVRALEDRPAFHALQVTLAWEGQHFETRGVVHVAYWIGLESVGGNLVSNGVRLASEGQTISGCNDFLDDATSSSLSIKPLTAEATVRVQPRTQAQLEEDEPVACQWDGVVHWKAGAGFRVRKLSEDCKASARVISISDDGTIKAAASK
jgi:hypothetical protein